VLVNDGGCGCWLQIKTILQRLISVNTTPTIGLAEAAELLCEHLGVALVRWVRLLPAPALAWRLMHGVALCTAAQLDIREPAAALVWQHGETCQV